MTMTLLEICEEALETTSVEAPSSIVSSNPLSLRLLRLANTAGRDIARRYEWQSLKVEATFTTIADATQFNIRTNYPNLRKIVEKTMWNRTREDRVWGPMSELSWQRVQARGVDPAGLYYRIRGNSFLLAGTWEAGETIAFEYITKKWVSNAAGNATYERFEADTDYPLIDDHALVLGIRWRYREALGLEYSEHFREYESYLETCMGDDTEKDTLSMTPHTRKGNHLSVTLTEQRVDFSDDWVGWDSD